LDPYGAPLSDALASAVDVAGAGAGSGAGATAGGVPVGGELECGMAWPLPVPPLRRREVIGVPIDFDVESSSDDSEVEEAEGEPAGGIGGTYRPERCTDCALDAVLIT
jgi:hypothetical protein